MLIIKINRFDSQTLQTSFDRLRERYSGLPLIIAIVRIVRVAINAEFRRNYKLVAFAFDRFADQFFIRVWSIHFRRVEKIYAEFQRAMNRLD